MITVIIPTLNEQTTISQVIQPVKKVTTVTKILAIDDKSPDDTIKNAKREKVKIYTGTKSGKSVSIRDGMVLANNEIIVYLDVDIVTYPKNIINLLTEPIISNNADLLKSFNDNIHFYHSSIKIDYIALSMNRIPNCKNLYMRAIAGILAYMVIVMIAVIILINEWINKRKNKFK
jgi:glycosyltransferase involved in cell wall biosynthesis